MNLGVGCVTILVTILAIFKFAIILKDIKLGKKNHHLTQGLPTA